LLGHAVAVVSAIVFLRVVVPGTVSSNNAGDGGSGVSWLADLVCVIVS